MSIASLLKDGVSAVVGTIGTAARDIRAAITGKEIETEAGRIKVMDLAHEIEMAALEADKQMNVAQIELNKIEAADPNIFKSGWRPAVGWVCVFALAYQFLIRPLVPWCVGLFHSTVAAMPILDMNSLMTILLGILGIGGLRTFEKVKGIK
jgi:hypothetical protein